MPALLNLLPAVLIPFFSLFYTNVIIPHILGPEQFSLWRISSAFLAFSGATHLGLADGIYRQWVYKITRPVGLDHILFRSYFVIVLLVSFIFTLIFWRINGYTFWFNFAFLIGSISIGAYSLTIYALGINEDGRKLSVYTSLQPISFLIIVAVFGRWLNAQGVLYAFALSFITVNIIYIPKIIFGEKRQLKRVFPLIIDGLPILIANLSLIFYLNADKINISRTVSVKSLGDYLLSSSFFVASAGLGSSIGNLLLSKQRSLFLSIFRRYLAVALLLTSAFLSGILLNYFNFRFGIYNISWLPTLLSCATIFSFAGIYAPIFRIIWPKFSVIVLFISGIAVFTTMQFITRVSSINSATITVLLGGNLIILVLHEVILSKNTKTGVLLEKRTEK